MGTTSYIIVLAIGYPDEDASINQFRSKRVPMPIKNVAWWVD